MLVQTDSGQNGAKFHLAMNGFVRGSMRVAKSQLRRCVTRTLLSGPVLRGFRAAAPPPCHSGQPGPVAAAVGCASQLLASIHRCRLCRRSRRLPRSGFKSQPGTAGFHVFSVPGPVRDGKPGWFFIFYVFKFKNTKVICLYYCSGFKQCHRFLKPCLGHGRVEDVASLLQIADLRLARSLLRRDDRRRPRTELRACRLN